MLGRRLGDWATDQPLGARQRDPAATESLGATQPLEGLAAWAGRGTGWQLHGGVWLRMQERVRACLTDFRRIVGMPDYQEYVRHLRLMHPAWPVPSEREFFQLYLQTRYGDGPTRCC